MKVGELKLVLETNGTFQLGYSINNGYLFEFSS